MSRHRPQRAAHKEARRLIVSLRAEGWDFTGFNGSGHLHFEHPSGAELTAPSTPRARHYRRTLQQARRLIPRTEEKPRLTYREGAWQIVECARHELNVRAIAWTSAQNQKAAA